MKLELNGNVLTATLPDWRSVITYVRENAERQIAISPCEEGFTVSSPLAKEERPLWKELYEEQGRDPYEEFTPRPMPTKPKPRGPKPTGPRGGGPSGTPGAGRQVELTYTEAMAA